MITPKQAVIFWLVEAGYSYAEAERKVNRQMILIDDDGDDTLAREVRQEVRDWAALRVESRALESRAIKCGDELAAQLARAAVRVCELATAVLLDSIQERETQR